jgi:membrane-bound lytic murein transglycosylase D
VVTNRTISIAIAVLAGACARPAVMPAPVPSVAPAEQSSSPPPAESPAQPVTQQATPIPTPPAVEVRVDSTTVARRATGIFGDAPPSQIPDAAPADATATTGPSWDIEVHEYESTDRVEHYVRLYTGRARDRIQSRLEAGTRYESMIRSRMREGGIPEDMYYLALIESGFDPNAYSRAAAVGMWQFMTSTARDMGLRVDWWVDERRDPFRSTTAAVRFIRGLRDQFGSLYLAAAAYNGGPGRIARGLSRYADDFEGTTGDDLFFALAEKDYLRNETREYVPQLIAAALIAKEPEKYGMKIDSQPALTYDSVRVGPSTAVGAVARAAGTSHDAVRELNPHILRGVTPPRDSFFVRIPSGLADSTAAALAAMPKSAKVGLFTVESKKGATIESIARDNGVSARLVALYNPKLRKLKSGKLVVGQTVFVPTSAVSAAAISVPDPEIERYGPSTSRSATMHVVKSGETLGGIAKRYGTTTKSLLTLNGLKKPLIFPGQSLVVKGTARKPAATKKASVATKKSSAAKPRRVAAEPKGKAVSKPATGPKTKPAAKGKAATKKTVKPASKTAKKAVKKKR